MLATVGQNSRASSEGANSARSSVRSGNSASAGRAYEGQSARAARSAAAHPRGSAAAGTARKNPRKTKTFNYTSKLFRNQPVQLELYEGQSALWLEYYAAKVWADQVGLHGLFVENPAERTIHDIVMGKITHVISTQEANDDMAAIFGDSLPKIRAAFVAEVEADVSNPIEGKHFLMPGLHIRPIRNRDKQEIGKEYVYGRSLQMKRNEIGQVFGAAIVKKYDKTSKLEKVAQGVKLTQAFKDAVVGEIVDAPVMKTTKTKDPTTGQIVESTGVSAIETARKKAKHAFLRGIQNMPVGAVVPFEALVSLYAAVHPGNAPGQPGAINLSSVVRGLLGFSEQQIGQTSGGKPIMRSLQTYGGQIITQPSPLDADLLGAWLYWHAIK